MNLDDLERFRQLDTTQMLDALDAMPLTLRATRATCSAVLADHAPGRYRRILFMDDTLIGPDVLPIISGLYQFTEGTRVILTEQPLQTAGTDALQIRRGEAELIVQDTHTRFAIPEIREAATGGATTTLAAYLLILGWANALVGAQALGDALDEAAIELERGMAMLNAAVPTVQNPAKRLAGQMMNRLPLVLGSGTAFAVAEHWKRQIQLIAKSWAQAEDLDQRYFQAGAGLMFPEFLLQKMHCVFLAPIAESPSPVMDPTALYFLQGGLSIDQLAGHGQSAVSQVMSLIQFSAYTSYYLAMAYGTDPAPLPWQAAWNGHRNNR